MMKTHLLPDKPACLSAVLNQTHQRTHTGHTSRNQAAREAENEMHQNVRAIIAISIRKLESMFMVLEGYTLTSYMAVTGYDWV